jgi:hypothetical protein
MRRVVTLVAVGVVLVVVGVAYALTPQGVKTSRAQELTPAADFSATGTSLFAWSQNTRAHPRRFDAFFQKAGQARVKLNTRGRGFLGGIEPPLVIYQQVVRDESSIRLYDFETAMRSAPPAGVNSADWDWAPDIWGDWILFGRDDDQSHDQWVLLQSRSLPTQLVLETIHLNREQVYPGQVNDDYVVWTYCGLECDVRKWAIPTDHTPTQVDVVPETLPKATATHQYAAAVTSTGVVYLIRSGDGCGVALKVVRFGPDDPPDGTVIASIPNGKDVGGDGGYVRERLDGSVDYFFDRVDCSSGRYDIYKVVDPPPTP